MLPLVVIITSSAIASDYDASAHLTRSGRWMTMRALVSYKAVRTAEHHSARTARSTT